MSFKAAYSCYNIPCHPTAENEDHSIPNVLWVYWRNIGIGLGIFKPYKYRVLLNERQSRIGKERSDCIQMPSRKYFTICTENLAAFSNFSKNLNMVSLIIL